jgi:hypothetical protein
MDPNSTAQPRRPLGPTVGWVAGALLAWIVVATVGLEGPGILGSSAHVGVLLAVVLGGSLGAVLVPAIGRAMATSH